jgi:flagellar hook-associated protein 2
MAITSATSSTYTPAITSLGVGSGLDAQGIVDKLMAVEQRPVTQLQTQVTGLKTQLSSYGQLQSLMSTFQSKAQALSSLTLWNQTTPSSADPSVLTASTSAGAAHGSYAVSVQQLASSQTVTSGVFTASTTTVGTGTLSIQLGSWTGGPPATGFSAKTGAAAVNINVAATDTLDTIRDSINAAGVGVTATIINDASGARLSLSSSATGAANGFSITASAGVSALGYDPLAGATGMGLNQSAGDAQATINGIQVSSASNTLSNVSNGLTLNLLKVSAAPVQLSVATNTEAVNTAVKDFVTAFNGLASFIQTQTAYDAGAKKGAPLQGDRATVGLQWALRGVINQASTASSVFGRLSDVGISMQKDGTLAINSAKLTNGLGNLPELRKLFATDSGTSEGSGFATRFNTLATAALDFTGSLTTRQQGIQRSIDLNEKQQAAMTTRLAQVRERLTKQYQTLDTKMSSLQALSTYVTQQFASKTTSS